MQDTEKTKEQLIEELAALRLRVEALADIATELQATDIINNIQVGLYIYHLENSDDHEGRTLRMVFSNQAAADMTGIVVENVVGNLLDENFP